MEKMTYMDLMRRETDNRQFRSLKGSEIRAVEGEGNERKFIVSFSSEAPYERWWGVEILDHSEGSVDLSRLNGMGCVLFNHDRNKVIGKINRAWIENRRGNAEIEFDEDEESEKIFQKVKSGTLKGTSVGYVVGSWEEIAANKTSADGRFSGPASVARRWEALEISIASIPADASVGVGRAKEGSTGWSLGHYERQLVVNENIVGGEKA